jgi:hypothetical protein
VQSRAEPHRAALVAAQRCGKHLSAALPGNASVNTPFQLLEDLFPLWSVQRLYSASYKYNRAVSFLSEGSDIQVSRKPGVQKNTRGLPVMM